MRALGLIGLVVVLVLAGAVPAPAQDEPRWSLATSVNYSIGDYGTGKDTTILYVPFTLGVRPIDRLWLSLTVPYIYISGENVVLTGGGVAARKRGNGKLARPDDSSSESGLGDVLVKVSYVALPEQTLIPEIVPWLKIKAPTADEDRGLGTGEFDETLGVDLSKRLVDRVVGFLTLSYTFIGDPPGTNLRNSFGWSVGGAYEVTRPFSVFAFLDGSTAVTPGQTDPVELRLGAEYALMRGLKLMGSVTRGLTDGAADWGVSAGVALRF
ncbi:MAG TPA: transporter [Methylomirabilota bacterium]|jgi:hypothetical protein|nr:transporter [Methylomirabilota bacterium]